MGFGLFKTGTDGGLWPGMNFTSTGFASQGSITEFSRGASVSNAACFTQEKAISGRTATKNKYFFIVRPPLKTGIEVFDGITIVTAGIENRLQCRQEDDFRLRRHIILFVHIKDSQLFQRP